MSQLDLACLVDVSARHLSFVETGRAKPSREMVLQLAAGLNVPLRDRNALLIAAGFAPQYHERSLSDPELAAARQAVDLVLRGHEPYPALAIDRHWTLVAANRAVDQFLDGLPRPLLEPPVNVLRVSLHPEGLAPRILNLHEWRAHVLHRLRQQIDYCGDPALVALLAELQDYPVPYAPEAHEPPPGPPPVVIPLRLRSPVGTLSFLSTTTVFGTPVDITLAELAIESFFPADRATAEVLGSLRTE